jgi:hypothetical protein
MLIEEVLLVRMASGRVMRSSSRNSLLIAETDDDVEVEVLVPGAHAADVERCGSLVGRGAEPRASPL